MVSRPASKKFLKALADSRRSGTGAKSRSAAVLPPDRIDAKFSLHHILSEVATERARQDSIFGVQKLPDGTGGGGRKTWETIARNWCDRATREGILTFADILDEEVAEVLAETDPAKLRVELIQAAAVCLKWAQDLDRRAAAAKAEGGS